jgi:tellurite resistance protein TerC
MEHVLFIYFPEMSPGPTLLSRRRPTGPPNLFRTNLEDSMVDSIGSPLLWGAFIAFVLVLLALDLGVFHRKAHEVKFKEAAGWSVFWVALALAFNAWVAFAFGPQRGMEFLTGYLIEKALSVDNVFVFLVVFSSFSVPASYQHRVLFWGVLGALVMRAIFIFAGAAALEAFHWVIYVFGGILLLTGVKLLFSGDKEQHPEHNPLFRLFQKLVPTTSRYHGQRFWVREGTRVVATPLLTVLVLIEITDLVFAVDSIPAIFAVTRDPFIVFTSNIFAILGLRALYFCLAGFVHRLRYLKVGLALVLIFVAIKMLVSEFYKLPITLSLGVIATLLGGAVVASLLATRRERTSAGESDPPAPSPAADGVRAAAGE